MRKQNWGFLLFFVLLMLVIPAFALLGKRPEPAPQTDILGFPGVSSPAADVPALPQENYDANDFYLVQDHKTGEVMALTREDYVKGVVAAEMPISYHSEALKAQAVAAHTYALRQMGEQLAAPDPALKGAYLSTDPAHFQAYLSPTERRTLWGKNYEANEKKLTEAVEAVIDEALTYEGEPIQAAFHSLSGGRTESAETVWGRAVSYLTPVESEGDELSPDYEADTVLKPDEVSHALKAAHTDLELPEEPGKWFEVTSRTDSGTVSEAAVGNLTLTGREVREALKLRSANFTVEYADGNFTFHTVGYGHGVGMSQYGADYFARQGFQYQQILLHYYTGVELTKIEP